MHKRGGELCNQIKLKTMKHKILYWFSTTQFEFHYPQVLQMGSPGTFTTASFRTGSLATLQPQVLLQAHLQPC